MSRTKARDRVIDEFIEKHRDKLAFPCLSAFYSLSSDPISQDLKHSAWAPYLAGPRGRLPIRAFIEHLSRLGATRIRFACYSHISDYPMSLPILELL
jgi:hypothetical protein